MFYLKFIVTHSRKEHRNLQWSNQTIRSKYSSHDEFNIDICTAVLLWLNIVNITSIQTHYHRYTIMYYTTILMLQRLFVCHWYFNQMNTTKWHWCIIEYFHRSASDFKLTFISFHVIWYTFHFKNHLYHDSACVLSFHTHLSQFFFFFFHFFTFTKKVFRKQIYLKNNGTRFSHHLCLI